MKVLVTGAAGFIGSFVAKQLLENNHEVVGLDNLNDYYSVELKKDRLKNLSHYEKFTFVQGDIKEYSLINELFETQRFNRVVHLAAQAGVRYSIENPFVYIDSNITGFINVLEACRHYHIEHLVYASSSSVYGSNTKLPFSTEDNVDHPISLYAATKKSNELMAHVYSHLYHIPTTGLRFFTVYGPWGRPDMALFKFVKAIYNGDEVSVYNNGEMIRDFTYVDDIVTGILKILELAPQSNPNMSMTERTPDKSHGPYRVYNIGNNQPVPLMAFIEAIEEACGKKAKLAFLPMQQGDVPATHADVTPLEHDFNYCPNTSIKEGVNRFVKWYKDYYRLRT
ncbi:NAD-dependent epimerase [Candidatus Berkiella cookevillensis]|uniref:NAD-dependent epimerase n=1 Tax=Candidatus Berkiella cookevillensis TaxID=437022 RepID=A0A0Q9YCI0_9GAMM|nr:NAD-dependent epimerase [Candidatus Berkiella cookevillensis]MCS5708734.1 NAD-dependent epimerase [Candidatus Berkiella cookevillensis]